MGIKANETADKAAKVAIDIHTKTGHNQVTL